MTDATRNLAILFADVSGSTTLYEKLGDRASARANYEQLIKLLGQPQSDRAEVKAAYQFLGKG